MTDILYDPTGEFAPLQRAALAKPASLAGLTIGLLDISKSRGDVFLDHLDLLLTGEGLTVKRYKKPTFTRPAPLELLQQIASACDVVIEGLAD
ncbi:unnamed protein product [Phaeothamnion confervicola]